MPAPTPPPRLSSLAQADRQALNWISNQLGAAQTRRLFILVAGLSFRHDEAYDLDQSLQHQAELTAQARAVIGRHGGRVGARTDAVTIGYWPCLGLSAWRKAEASAQALAVSGNNQPPASVCLHAGSVRCSDAEENGSGAWHIAGPIVQEATHRQRLTSPGGMWRSASFNSFPEDWLDLAGDEIDVANTFDSDNKRTCENILADPTWTVTPSFLTARCDQALVKLGEVSAVIKAAAVLGQPFSLDQLAHTLRLSRPALQPLLDHLVCDDILISSTKRSGEKRYSFCDQRLRDVAYSHLPGPLLATLHSRAADALLSLAREAQTSIRASCELAAHFQRSRNAKESVRWWTIAGRAAVRSSQPKLARALFENALDQFSDADVRRNRFEHTGLLHSLGTQLAVTKGIAASDTRMALRGHIQPKGINIERDTKSQFNGLWCALAYHLTSGNVYTARRIARRLLNLARHQSDKHNLLTHRLVGLTELLAGRPTAAFFHLSRCIEIYDPANHAELRFIYGSDPLATAHAHRAWASAMRGKPAMAIKDADAAIARARSLHHPHTLAQISGVLALVHEILNNRTTALIHCMTAATLADLHAFSYWREWSATLRASIDLDVRPSEARYGIVQSDERYQVKGVRQLGGYVCCRLANAYLHVEDIENSQQFAKGGLLHSRRTGIVVALPQLHLIAAKCHQRSGETEPFLHHLKRSYAGAVAWQNESLVEQILRIANNAPRDLAELSTHCANC